MDARNTDTTSGLPAELSGPDADESYLAYVRPVPPPFRRFVCGHFPSGTVTQPHSHPCLALHGCIQGPVTMVTAAGELPLDAGDFYLIAPGVRHHWRNPSGHTVATLGLLIDADRPNPWPAGSGVDACCRELRRNVRGTHCFSVVGDSKLQSAYWSAVDHLVAEEPRESVLMVASLLALLGHVSIRLRENEPARAMEADAAQQIRRLLLSRVSDRLSIDEIARAVAMSPTQAKTIFRRAFGCGIISYHNQLKIWQAKRLLCDPALTIEQVSGKMGFSSPAQFCQVYRRITGETPTAFRRHTATSGRDGRD